MATVTISKPKKPNRTADDLDSLKSDVASFASSLGLAPPSAASAGGFDDSDFRKSGPLKPPSTQKIPNISPPQKNAKKSSDHEAKPSTHPKPKPKPHPLQLDPFAAPASKASAGVPKLRLMNPTSLSRLWFDDADELEGRVLGGGGAAKAVAVRGMEELKALAGRKREVAERLMEQYTSEYEVARRKSRDMRLLEVTARSGTSADKVSAFTCLVEDNPIANLRSLDALVSMVTSKVGKRYAFSGFEALKELFKSRLLPDRKLKSLLQRPLDNLPESKDGFSLLLFWYWEESLKQRYERFVIALEEALKDMLPNLKDKAMKTVYDLLRSKSEQERRLLTALVNKLGDPEKKAASNAGYHLSCLLSAHPNMKGVVIDEVDSFIFRPHIGLRAKYQAVNFLSQILLSKKGDGPKVAKRLVDVYFALFKVLIAEAGNGRRMDQSSKRGRKNAVKRKEKGGKDEKKNSSLQNSKEEASLESNAEMDSRLLSAILTGVNRAFPYVLSDEADDIIEVQTPILFKLVHSENFNVSVQALMLLYQISSKNQIVSDRFYRALYSKLLTPAAVNSSKPEMFLGLLVKSMKNDVNLKRISAFSKRLLQVAVQRPSQYACGCLFLLSEVLKAKPPLWSMMLQNESVDDELEHFVDIKEEPENGSGNLSCKNSRNLLGFPTVQGSESLPVSHLEDAYKYEEDVDEGKQCDVVADAHIEQAQSLHVGSSLPAGYNPRHREPSYCNADRTGWWELAILATHVHPSVATMARTLLSGANIVYNGDPFNDLSLNAFLDKFMEKKPKPNRKAEGMWHGGSQIAPARKLDMNHHLIGDEILQLAEEDVPPEDVVFHRFYVNKTSSSKKPKAKKKKATEDDEAAEELLANASDESEEEEIDSMLGSGRLPFDEADGEYDYDDLDRVADDSDDDLLGDGSDADDGAPTNSTKQKHDRDGASDHAENDGSIDIWDDDGEDSDFESGNVGGDESTKASSGKKRKLKGITRASPFASLDDYEHLMSVDRDTGKKSKSQKNNKKNKAVD